MNLFLANSIYLTFFSLKNQKNWNRPKYTANILLCIKRNDSQTFKSSNCKKRFIQCVCYWCNLLQ